MFVNYECWLGAVPARLHPEDRVPAGEQLQNCSSRRRSHQSGPAKNRRDLQFDHDIAENRYVCRIETYLSAESDLQLKAEPRTACSTSRKD